MIERYFIEQGMKKIRLEDYFKKELSRAGFTEMKVNKTPLVTRIVLQVAKPGLAIGKKGKTIRTLTEEIAEKFGIENPQIEIQQIEKPELNAKAMIDRIVALLSRGYSWRSVAFRSIGDIMNAGAQGAELVFKGKLAGKGGRKRKERIGKGYMKKAGEQSFLVDYAQGDAYPKAGAIGVKLRIIKPDTVFPDKVKIEEIIKAEKGKKDAVEEEKEMEKKAGEKEGEKKEAEKEVGKKEGKEKRAGEEAGEKEEREVGKKEGKEKRAGEEAGAREEKKKKTGAKKKETKEKKAGEKSGKAEKKK